jgi:hypothetical protein
MKTKYPELEVRIGFLHFTEEGGAKIHEIAGE